MTTKARTIAIVVAIILIAFGIYLSAPLVPLDLIFGLPDRFEDMTRQVEILERIPEAESARVLSGDGYSAGAPDRADGRVC